MKVGQFFKFNMGIAYLENVYVDYDVIGVTSRKKRYTNVTRFLQALI